ncbi:TPA: nickel transporter, partial [Klebsiella aerogenes]|nr:nickel transporter [Klebsiella aerogenes]
MSVVFTPRARAPRWKSLWPLALFLTLTVVGGIW